MQGAEAIINVGPQVEQVAYTTNLCGDLACIVSWADHWQALLGSAIALPLTFLAITVPWWIENQKYRRRLASMRASMPLRLSQVSHYSIAAMKALADVRPRVGTAGVILNKPALPDDLVDGLERTIEAIGRKRVVERLSNMIGEMQVIESRMSGLEFNHESGANVDAYLVQAATIHAQADSLFDFARRRASSVPAQITWDNIRTGLRIAGVYDAQFPDVHKFIERSDDRKNDPEDNDPRMSPWLKFRLWLAIRAEQVRDRHKRGQRRV